MRNSLALGLGLFFTVIAILMNPILDFIEEFVGVQLDMLSNQNHNFMVLGIAFLIIFIMRKIKTRFLKRFDITVEDNLRSRKVHTQVGILEKIIIFIVFLFATGIILLSFERIRDLGVGLFASAGVAGIIIGLSAQKMVGALLAGTIG